MLAKKAGKRGWITGPLSVVPLERSIHHPFRRIGSDRIGSDRIGLDRIGSDRMIGSKFHLKN